MEDNQVAQAKPRQGHCMQKTGSDLAARFLFLQLKIGLELEPYRQLHLSLAQERAGGAERCSGIGVC